MLAIVGVVHALCAQSSMAWMTAAAKKKTKFVLRQDRLETAGRAYSSFGHVGRSLSDWDGITAKDAHMRPSNMQLPLAGLVFAAVVLLSLSPVSAQTAAGRTLSLAGNAEVHAVPDAALVSIGVVSEGDTAAAALKANSTALAKVMEAIHAAGVEGKDVQTSGLSLQARYYRPDKPSPTDRPCIFALHRRQRGDPAGARSGQARRSARQGHGCGGQPHRRHRVVPTGRLCSTRRGRRSPTPRTRPT